MRALAQSLLVVLLVITVAAAQQSAVPQTARQALLEMFFGKEAGTFVKHLPAATRAALEKSGGLTGLQQLSALTSQMQTQGQSLQTFETGSLLLVTENQKTGDKFEMTVENDSLHGDQDDIEVSFQAYKNGKAQSRAFMPQMTFSMKQESEVWKLNEISLTLRLPLADPDFLKAIAQSMKPSASATAGAMPQNTAGTSLGNDALVTAALKSIVAAEATYASRYPTIGYTCALSDLDGFGGGEPNEHQAMLIHSGLASGRRYGYVFSLAGCAGTPAGSFQLTATPSGNAFGRKAYCADQSGAIRSSVDGNPGSCLEKGVPVQ
jgi:hypothetical protein